MTVCPRCEKNELKEPHVRHCSLSRKDNETYICSMRGTEEALLDAGMLHLSDEILLRDARIPEKL